MEKAVKFAVESERGQLRGPLCTSIFQAAVRVKRNGFIYSRVWRKMQVWWRRLERESGASMRPQSQRGPSASSQAVGEPRRPVGILVPPIALAETLSRP